MSHSVDHAFFFVQLPAKRDSKLRFFVRVQDSIGLTTIYTIAISSTLLPVSWEFSDSMSMGAEAEGAFDSKSARRPTKHQCCLKCFHYQYSLRDLDYIWLTDRGMSVDTCNDGNELELEQTRKSALMIAGAV